MRSIIITRNDRLPPSKAFPNYKYKLIVISNSRLIRQSVGQVAKRNEKSPFFLHCFFAMNSYTKAYNKIFQRIFILTP